MVAATSRQLIERYGADAPQKLVDMIVDAVREHDDDQLAHLEAVRQVVQKTPLPRRPRIRI